MLTLTSSTEVTLPQEKAWRPAISTFVLALIALALARSPVVDWLDAILPTAATVRSAGTGFPSFAEAMGHALPMSAWLLLAAAMGSLLSNWASPPPRSALPFGVLVGAAAAVCAAWSALPPNAFPSNARIHWVDNLFERSDDYFYALVKLPNRLFYENPWALAALLSLTTAGLVYAILRRSVPGRPLLAPLAAATVTAASTTTLFSNAAEDVALTVVTVLAVALALVSRAPVSLGLAIFVATLARPQMVILVPAVVLSEVLAAALEPRNHRLWPMVVRVLGSRSARRAASALIVPSMIWQGYLYISGNGWLLVEGQLIASPLIGLDPRAIDDFIITPFSGSYLFHLIWVLSPPVIVASLLAARGITKLSPEGRRLFMMAWFFMVGTVLLSEIIVLYYYNVRYLAYAIPLVLAASWTALTPGVPVTGGKGATTTMFAILLAAGPAMLPQPALDVHRQVAQDPLGRAYWARYEIRDEVQGLPVGTDMPSDTDVNYLSYILRRSIDQIDRYDVGSAPPDQVIFTQEIDRYEGAAIVWSGNNLWAAVMQDGK